MDKIFVKIIFAAVSDKSILEPLLKVLDKKSVRFWGTQGTADYLKKKNFSAISVVTGFDFDGRVKSLDRETFNRILADRSKKRHLDELEKLGVEPFDLVVVDLYKPDKKNFPKSMDIGGQALIRAAIKNYKYVAIAFDSSSLASLVAELVRDNGSTTLDFRRTQAKKAAKFIAQRCKVEGDLL